MVDGEAVLGVRPSIRSDREQFLSAVHAGDSTTAMSVYGGAFLLNITAAGSDAFDDWAMLERHQLEESLMRMGTAEVRHLLAVDRPTQAALIADQLVARAPDHTVAKRLVIDVALARSDAVTARRAADQLEAAARALGAQALADAAPVLARARQEPLTPKRSGQSGAIRMDLIGRDAPFQTILDGWRHARNGEARIVLVTGVAGIGKSRLLTAISQRLRASRVPIALVRGRLGERRVSHALTAAIARALVCLPGASGVSTASAGALVALDPALGMHYPLAVPLADPGDVARQWALAMLDLCTAVTEQQPWVLLVDDVQWADDGSRALLTMLIGRMASLPLLVVLASRERQDAVVEGTDAVRLHLDRLSEAEIREVAFSTGTWPDGAQVSAFMDRLIRACDGIPQELHERLSVGLERGTIDLEHGSWHSVDWDAATRLLTSGEPVDQQFDTLAPSDVWLLTLASLAGIPVTAEVLLAAVGGPENQSSAADAIHALEDQLAILAQAGWLGRWGNRWQMGHDRMAERVLGRTPPDQKRQAHAALAKAFAEMTPPDISRSLRHAVLAEDDALAGQQLVHLLTLAAAQGEQRRPGIVLADAVGNDIPPLLHDRILRRVPKRWRWMHWRMPLLVAGLVATVGCSAWYYWHQTTRPALVLLQSAVMANTYRQMPTNPPGSVQRLVPAAILGIKGRPGSLHQPPPFMRVRVVEGSAQVVAGDSAIVRNGVAVFTDLRLLNREPIIGLQFEADGFKPVAVRIPVPTFASSEEMFRSLYPLAGMLNGQPVDSAQRRIRIRRGERLVGQIWISYSNDWETASVWLSMTPTWGASRVEGQDLLPLITPIQKEVIDVPVDLPVPTAPGRFWLAFIMDAEPSGGFALSRTSWKVGRPIWDDGNDLAEGSEALWQEVNRTGAVSLPVAVPVNDHSACTGPIRTSLYGTFRYCPRSASAFAIEILVE